MPTRLDLGGENVIVNDIVVASSPGQTGTPLNLSTVTPGTVAPSAAVVADSTSSVSGFNNIGFTGFLNESVGVGITAGTTRTQAGATALTKEINRIDTSTAPAVGSTLGDGVALPVTVANVARDIAVINNTANPIQIYGAGADTVNGVAAAIGISQSPNSVALYMQTGTGGWYSIDVAMGYSGNYQTTSAINGLTAFATGGQASAVLLPAMINRVTTVGAAGDSVKLPVSATGMNIYVANAAAVNSMNVFPAAGETINALGANAAFAIAAGKTATFICANAGQWHAILSA